MGRGENVANHFSLISTNVRKRKRIPSRVQVGVYKPSFQALQLCHCNKQGA